MNVTSGSEEGTTAADLGYGYTHTHTHTHLAKTVLRSFVVLKGGASVLVQVGIMEEAVVIG